MNPEFGLRFTHTNGFIIPDNGLIKFIRPESFLMYFGQSVQTIITNLS